MTSPRSAIFARVPPAPTPSHPLLDRLWARYVVDVPHAARFAALHARGAQPQFKNDHIALRTLGFPGPGIASFAPVFERLGWKHAGDYVFPDVHLRAVYLTRAGFPRIFISELMVEALPVDARRALVDLAIDTTPAPGNFDALAAWFGAPRPAPAAAVDVVAHASQYGAWLLAFGRKVNHFTAAVDDVAEWQRRLLAAGVPMKADIEGAPGGDLRQTATQAVVVDVPTAEGGRKKLPYAYFEIAERHRGFDGFLAPQARQLFDMTAPAARIAVPALVDDVVDVDDIAAPYVSQRAHPRKDVVVDVEVSWGGGTAHVRVATANLSVSGVFLTLGTFPREAPSQGTVLQLSVAVPGLGRVAATGTVMWVMPRKGVGVQLTWWDEDDDARAVLERFLKTVT